jgi:hypothetical protein
MLPRDFDDMFLAGTLTQFDGVASYSSIEHSGI